MMYAVTAVWGDETVYVDPEGVFQTAPTGLVFGPLIRDAYFRAMNDPRLTAVQIVEVPT